LLNNVLIIKYYFHYLFYNLFGMKSNIYAYLHLEH